ncbi:MAG: LytTR family DNA-binding domain-containing protein [Pseudomonadota bacterium]
MREWLRLRGPLGIWLVASLLAAAAGPFGTYSALPEIWTRAGYWSGVAAVSVLLGVIAGRLSQRIGPNLWQAPLWIGLTLLIAGLVHAVNLFLFPDWGGFGSYLYLVSVVTIVVVSVHAILWLVGASVFKAREESPTGDALMRRLPAELRGPLVRLEAQDHYTRVVTTKGQTLVLMRLSDAMANLPETQGLQVHRSHWIARDAVRAVRGGRAATVLEMSDGAEVPVSRKRRDAARGAGVIR